MLEQTYLSSGQRAALYELMADTPGFAAVPHAADIIGRPGIGIAWQAPGGSGRNMIIFDATTYAELGITTWGAHHEKGGGALLKPPFSLRMLNGCRLVSAPWLGRPCCASSSQ